MLTQRPQRCPTVFEIGPTLKQHWFIVICLLGTSLYGSYREELPLPRCTLMLGCGL